MLIIDILKEHCRNRLTLGANQLDSIKLSVQETEEFAQFKEHREDKFLIKEQHKRNATNCALNNLMNTAESSITKVQDSSEVVDIKEFSPVEISQCNFDRTFGPKNNAVNEYELHKHNRVLETFTHQGIPFR